jgi:hypothetical protein
LSHVVLCSRDEGRPASVPWLSSMLLPWQQQQQLIVEKVICDALVECVLAACQSTYFCFTMWKTILGGLW